MKPTLKFLKQTANELEELLEQPKFKDEFASEATAIKEVVATLNSVRRRMKAKLKDLDD